VTILPLHRDNTDDDLIGVWRLEATRTNGSPPFRGRELWVVRHGQLTVVYEDSANKTKISVDPSAIPKHLDLSNPMMPQGIYEVGGDVLQVALGLPHTPRPSSFTTVQGDFNTVYSLRHLDADYRLPEQKLRALLLSEFGPPKDYPEPIGFSEQADEFVRSLIEAFPYPPRNLSHKETAVFHVSRLMTEVNNGGFHQFFYNSSGDNAQETAVLLQEIDATETAAIVSQGCELFPSGGPERNTDERRRQLELFTLDQFDQLRDLEQRFYSRREDLNLLLRKFWEQGQ
jgi:uncharacterized protein (TIGR03067 family)